MKYEWTTHPPTEEGTYWFYGWTSDYSWSRGGAGDPPELITVRARLIGGGKLMLDARGEFLYAHQMRGQWSRIYMPEVPYVSREDYR